MANQIVVSAGAKVRNLQDVIIGTSGVLSSLAFDVANGVPRLDVNGKILVSQLPNSVMEYKGTWSAATNTPTLVNGTGNQGDVYLCNVAGTVDFGAGPIAFFVGDQVIYSGSIWQRASGATGTVTSVAVTESGDSLNITGSPITTSGTINIGFNGTNLQYVNGAGNLTTFPTLITSIGLSMPSAFSVANSPLTANGTIAVTGAGVASQYIRGDGTLADFPSSGGGGSSVSYYLNGGTSQGTIGGTTYYEMSKTAVIGTGVDFAKSGDGFIVAFLTDANDPAQLNIPAGNWNYEIYASMSSNGGTPQMYAELYVYDGTTFTLIATSSNEIIYDGTALNLYTFAMAVPATSLTLTDRLAIKLYATNSGGKTTTIHTQDGHLCQIITTFSTGITALNGLTAQVQYFQTGTSGTDFNILSTTATHTFNIPDASATARGLITTGTQTIAGTKTFNDATKNNGGIFLQNASSSSLAGYMNLGGLTNGVKFTSGGGISNTFTLPSATGYTFTFPAATGTIALTSDIPSITGLVPYTGATASVDLGAYLLTASGVDSVGYTARGSGTLSGYLILKQGTTYLGNVVGYNSINANARKYVFISDVDGTNYKSAIFELSSLTNNTDRTYTLPDASGTIALVGGSGVGTVTSVAALTIGTSGTDLSSTVANSTTTPVITLNVPTASATNRGALSSADWTTFNSKQGTITLTTTGTSGAATFSSNTLNIPNYGSALSSYVPYSGATSNVSLGAFWINTNFGYFTHGSTGQDWLTRTNNTTGNYEIVDWGSTVARVSLTASGNLGLGVTPSAWASFIKATQIGATTAIWDYLSVNSYFTNNAFIDSTGNVKYITTAPISLLGLYSGGFDFSIAASGTAGATATMVTAMFLKSTGNLLIGTTTDAGYKLDVNGTGRFTSSLEASGGFISNNDSNTPVGFYKLKPSSITTARWWRITSDNIVYGDFSIAQSAANSDASYSNKLYFNATGAATFSSSVEARSLYISPGGGAGSGSDGIANIQTASSTLGQTSELGLLIKNNGTSGYYSQIGFGYAESKVGAVIAGLITNGSGATSSALIFATRSTTTGSDAPTERMRITSGGNVLIGGTNVANLGTTNRIGAFRTDSANEVYLQLASTSSSTIDHAFFYNSTGLGGSIRTSSGTISLVNGSDYRMKTNIESLIEGLSIISKLNPCTFEYVTTEGSKFEGFIAHELQEIIPNAVFGKKDAINKDGSPNYQGIDTVKIIPYLVKAIQEMNTKIIQLEQFVATK
jgi:hypothetical protein